MMWQALRVAGVRHAYQRLWPPACWRPVGAWEREQRRKQLCYASVLSPMRPMS